MLAVHPEHANAKPVMMKMLKTVLNSFINPALLQFQINLVVITICVVMLPPPSNCAAAQRIIIGATAARPCG